MPNPVTPRGTDRAKLTRRKKPHAPESKAPLTCRHCPAGKAFTVPADDSYADYKMAAHRVKKHKLPLGKKAMRDALAHLERVRKGIEEGDVLAIGVTCITRRGLQSMFHQAGAPTRCVDSETMR